MRLTRGWSALDSSVNCDIQIPDAVQALDPYHA